MIGLALIVLSMFAVAGVALLLIGAVVASIALIVRGLLWLVLLPVRIVLALLFVPFLVIKTLLGGLFFLVMGPLFAAAVIVSAVVAAVLFAIPLAPLLLLAFAGWMYSRSAHRPTSLVR